MMACIITDMSTQCQCGRIVFISLFDIWIVAVFVVGNIFDLEFFVT